MNRPIYQQLAILVQAQENCMASGNDEWFERHGERAELLVRKYMPSGSGIDGGTTFEMEFSRPERLVLSFSYHHMNEYGMYTHWSEHEVIVTPSLASGFDLRITGRSPRNDDSSFKDMIHEVYSTALEVEIDPHAEFAGREHDRVGRA